MQEPRDGNAKIELSTRVGYDDVMSEAIVADYKDRRAGLIFFGLVQLVLGLLCLLFCLISIAGFATMSRQTGAPQLPFAQMLMSVAIYLVAGIILIDLGAGSMMCRRWARDLSLLIGWFWLIAGLITGGVMTFMMRALSDQIAGAQWVFTCMMAFFVIFGVLIPLAIILFYRSPNVRATCMARDPKPRWTERVPLPLLGLSLWTAFSAVAIFAASAYGVLAWVGTMITGPAAVAAYVVIAAVLAYVSWGLYHRSVVAWWVGIAHGVVAALYAVFVFPRVNYDELMRTMHMPPTPNVPNFSAIYRSPAFLGFLAVFWLSYFGYFALTYRYVARTATTSAPPAVPQP